MPKKMHDALNRSARKKGLTGKAKDRYVYGTMNKAKKANGGRTTVASLKQSGRKAKPTKAKPRVKRDSRSGGVRG